MGFVRTPLKGKVKIWALPIFKLPPGRDAHGPKRIILDKGELAEIYNSQGPVRHISYIEFPEGKIRGGHYHTRHEYFYIIRGQMQLEIADSRTGVSEKIKVHEGDLISISPKVAHQFKTIKAGHSIEFSKKRFRPEDTIKYNISNL